MTRQRPLILLLVGLLAASLVAPVAVAQTETATPTPTPTGAETTAETATPTPTPTPSGGDTGSSGGEQSAELTITQPAYIDSAVDESTQDGEPLYEANGEQLLITVDNIPEAAEIQNYGVDADEASLIERGDTYVLKPDADGTFSVWWTTSDGETYSALVQVESADYAHIEADRYEETQAQADAWSSFVKELEQRGIVDGDASMEDLQAISQDAAAWYEFYLNPFAALTGGFVALLMILITQPGGWLFLSLLFLVFGLSMYTLVRRNRTLERQFRDIEDLDEAERKAWEQEIKRAASKDTLQDWGLTDSDAEAIKQHTGARNPRQFAAWIADNIGEFRVVRTLLGAYEQLGHELEVRRDDDGEILSVELVGGDTDAEGDSEPVAADGGAVTVERIAPTGDAATDDVVKRLSWTDLEGDVLWHPEVDSSTLDLPVQNDRHSDGFDLIEEADIPIGEDGADHYILDRREEFVGILIEVVEEAAASTYTDEDGRPRPEVDFVEMVYQFVSVGSEKYRLPFWHLRDVLIETRGQLDDDERLDQLASKSEDNEL
jgi:hypothetical protein